MKIECQMSNLFYEEGAVQNNHLVEMMENILFISDCLTSVRIAKKKKNQWDCGQLASWKLFEICIHQDCNISVVIQSVGMENLRLIP